MNTQEAAQALGVSKSTLLRWISEGRVADVGRDFRNWRVWTDSDIQRVRRQLGLAQSGRPESPPDVNRRSVKVLDLSAFVGKRRVSG